MLTINENHQLFLFRLCAICLFDHPGRKYRKFIKTLTNNKFDLMAANNKLNYFSSIVYNTEHHIRIVELILNNGGEWKANLPVFDLPPALPPRKISRGTLN